MIKFSLMIKKKQFIKMIKMYSFGIQIKEILSRPPLLRELFLKYLIILIENIKIKKEN